MADYKELDQSYLAQTYGNRDLCLVSGKGVTVTDDAGREYLDFSSGIGVASLGYGDAGYHAALKAQIDKVVHTSNLYLNETSALAAQKLIKKGAFGKRVFFCNSGAEANEGLIKLARKYSFDKYGEGRSTILTLNHSFHGRTMATVTATGQERFHKFFDPFMPGFVYADATEEAVTAALDDSVCAILAEPIQGEGGVYVLPDAFLQFLRRICDEKDILLLFDEVQTGVSRTGKFYAHSYAGIAPDAVSLAKGLGGGLPIGAFVMSEKCADVLGAGDHGSTFGANPVSCAGACEVLDRVTDAAFLKNVCTLGDHIADTVKGWGFPVVTDVRHRGLMIGIEVASDPGEIRKKCREKGLLVLTAGENVVRMLPPLVLTLSEADAGLAILKEVLNHD